jgi:membrane-bound ClpP family serine protease
LYEQFHGRDGIAYGDLNPQGYVMIDQQRLPARADGSSYTADGTTVRVVRTDPLGITVRVINPGSSHTD